MTIPEWLEQLASSDSSTMEDSAMMQNLLRKWGGLPKAKVVYGVVYPEGYGRPVSINHIAKKLLQPKTEGE